jgi:hypothetical protein
MVMQCLSNGVFVQSHIGVCAAITFTAAGFMDVKDAFICASAV